MSGEALLDAGIVVASDRESVSLARLVPLITAAVVFGIAAAVIPPYAVGVFHDDGVYAILAKALASGHGYRYLNLPGAPAAAHYPPGYPLFLAVLWRLSPEFPQNIGFLLLAQAALLGVTAWGVQAFARRVLGWSEMAGAAAALVGTLSLPMMTLTSALLSEVLFAAMLFPVLALEERLVRDDGVWWPAVAGGVAAGALALVRVHALAVMVAVVALLVMRHRWKHVSLFLVTVLVVLLPWELATLHEAALPLGLRGSYGSYVGWYIRGIAAQGVGLVSGTVRTNLAEVGALLADRYAVVALGWVRLAAALLACFAALVGAFSLRKRAPVTVAFVTVYLIVMLVWPYGPWRFLWAIWPLVVAVVAAGCWELVRIARLRSSLALRTVAVAWTVALGAGCACSEFTAYRQHAWSAPARAATIAVAPLVTWVNAHTRADDLLMADDEPLVYLFTGRQTMPPRMFTAGEYVRPESESSPSASPAARAAFRELVSRYPVRFIVTIVPANAALAREGSGPGFRIREIGRSGLATAFAVERP